LDRQYEECVNLIKNEIQSTKHVCLTLDGWASCKQYSYLGVTIHYFSCDFTYKNRTLAVKDLCGNHKTVNMANAVIDILR
jgi:hypothetical protein